MHRCRFGRVRPATNTKFWEEKRRGNVERDKRNIRKLRRASWKVLVIWECQTRNTKSLYSRLKTFLKSYSPRFSVPSSPHLLIHTSATGGLISSQSQEVQKKCSKTVNFLQFLLKTRSFLTKNAKKCKFLLIFTPIFSPKTIKSYKITVFTTTNHPNFQNFPQKPLFS
jgi:hypothetical protein